MKCPECDKTLTCVDQVDGMSAEVHHCTDCGGYWFSEAEFDHAIRHATAPMDVEQAEAVSSVTCPNCTAWLVEVSPVGHAEVKIDRCPSCHGLWFNRGEVHALQRATNNDADDSPQSDWEKFKAFAYQVAGTFGRAGLS
ncbi:MAG: zf-TFIIB domain-containing protein [Gammaproteobacteria bacterium]|nr:zf-TFIIB domain-containing protein [Gammaproteobacteria bacterium]